ARRSIDLRGLRSLEGPGAHSWLLYEPRGRRVVSRLGTPRHEDVSPGIEDIPAEYQGARAWLLGPMPIERQLDLTRHLASCAGRFVVVDPHVPLGAPTLDRWREVLTHADAFFVSHEELDLPGADTDPLGAFAAFGERLRFVGVKRAARGGTLIDRLEKKVMDWAPASEPVVDATGAGDAFAAGFAAGWLLSGGVEGALDRARISAAIAIENWGAHGFMGISPEMAALRLAGGGVSATPTRRGTRTAEPRRGSGAAR
ncbi:MAG: hypothetical protein HYR73_06555, partial [Candidatus Eisenbacteria bacterium]|nr:hypothetical protein [Candidatus Eisenbacteria bacterium]